MIEEERLRKEEEERKATEEIERLNEEEKALIPWKVGLESKMSTTLLNVNDKEDWDKYLNCKDGYVNARVEKDLNGFLYEFKERSIPVNYC